MDNEYRKIRKEIELIPNYILKLKAIRMTYGCGLKNAIYKLYNIEKKKGNIN